MNEISGFISVFLGGASGVVVVEAAKFAAASMGQRASQKVDTYRRGTYWVGLLVLILVAGFVTVVSAGEGPIKLVNALQIGMNAPALITAWATASQREAIRKRVPSARISPNDEDNRIIRDSPSLFRRVLDDQAW
ncbi:MAG: hypothetical protein KDG55_05220 [Rhodocyclaceae bacterium]|nr:hypothetical protein [Rhodocyclaceae bacterium]